MILPMSEFVKAVQDDPRSTVTLHIIPHDDEGFFIQFSFQGTSTMSFVLGKFHGGVKLFKTLGSLYKVMDQIRSVRKSVTFVMC